MWSKEVLNIRFCLFDTNILFDVLLSRYASYAEENGSVEIPLELGAIP
jgi:hypothetical protein